MRGSKESRKRIETKRRIIHLRLSAVCCGFLLARGLAGGARCAGWDMPALTGSDSGALWGAILFGLGCAACCLAHGGFGEKTSAMTDALTAVLYTLYRLIVSPQADAFSAAVDGAAVLIALLTVCRGKPGAARTVVLSLLLIPARLCSLPPVEPMLLMRLGAMTCALSSAGLCGAAIARLSVSCEETDGAWVAVGAAAGLL